MNEIQAMVLDIQSRIRTLEKVIDADYAHLVRLAHIQMWLGGIIATLMIVIVVLNFRIRHLQKKMTFSLKDLTETQEKRLQIAFERIELLEKVVGLRTISPESAPPTPEVVQ